VKEQLNLQKLDYTRLNTKLNTCAYFTFKFPFVTETGVWSIRFIISPLYGKLITAQVDSLTGD
jgi:hypothetical protein